MNELDQIWPQIMGAAAEEASASGRYEVAEYLHLKATNDLIRSAAVSWLVDTFLEIADEAMRKRNALIVEREEPYTFRRGSSSMVGVLIDARLGVRRMGLAAGWARTPAHGIMQNHALAYAKFTHFGMPEAGSELRLVRGDTLPLWLDESAHPVGSEYVRRHLELLLS